MAYDAATIEELLRVQYEPNLEKLYELNNELQDTFDEGPNDQLRGKMLYIPFEINPDPSGAAGGGKSAVPATGNATFDHFEVFGTYYRKAFLVWNEASDVDQGEGAYINTLDQNVSECPAGIGRMVNMDMFFGRHYGLATMAAATGLAAVDVLNLFTSSLHEARGTRYLTVGQRVNILDPTAGTLRVNGAGSSVFTIVSVDSLTQVTLDAAIVGAAANDIMTREDEFNYGAAPPTRADPIGHQMYGLDEIIANAATSMSARMYGNYGAVDRTVVTATESIILDKGGANLDPAKDIRHVVQAVKHKTGKALDGPNSVWICHESVLDQWLDSVNPGTQYAPMSAPLGIGNASMTLDAGNGSKKFKTMISCPPNCMFLVNKAHMKRYKLRDMGFDKSNGGILKTHQAVVAGALKSYDAVWGFMTRGLQLFSSAPNAHAKILDIGGVDDAFGQGAGFIYLR